MTDGIKNESTPAFGKAETTYGTDSTPTGTANAILVRNLEITPIQADAVERELIRGYMGNFEVLLANQRVEVTFDVEMAASGTAGTAPKWGPIMKACGNSETVVANTRVTYAPISSTSLLSFCITTPTVCVIR